MNIFLSSKLVHWKHVKMGAHKDLSQGPKLPVFLGVPSVQWLRTTKSVLSRDSWRTGNWVMAAKDSAMCVGKEG